MVSVKQTRFSVCFWLFALITMGKLNHGLQFKKKKTSKTFNFMVLIQLLKTCLKRGKVDWQFIYYFISLQHCCHGMCMCIDFCILYQKRIHASILLLTLAIFFYLVERIWCSPNCKVSASKRPTEKNRTSKFHWRRYNGVATSSYKLLLFAVTNFS